MGVERFELLVFGEAKGELFCDAFFGDDVALLGGLAVVSDVT